MDRLASPTPPAAPLAERVSGPDGEGDNDAMSGGAGDDFMSGGPGEDKMGGDAGSDKLLGEDGADRLTGGTRKDVLSGGQSNDRIFARDGVRDVVHGGWRKQRPGARRRRR